MSKIIVVIGPTASGKTSLGVYLAKKYNACIINADAEQVYKDVNIGTAKITKNEMEGVKHYLLDFVPLDKDFNVVDEASLMQYIKPDFARLTDIGPSEDTDEDAKPDKKGLVAIKSGIKPKLREIEKKA